MIDFLKYNWSNKNYLERLRSADTKRKCFCVHSQGFIDSILAGPQVLRRRRKKLLRSGSSSRILRDIGTAGFVSKQQAAPLMDVFVKTPSHFLYAKFL